jgi:hypothetical protein
MTVLLDLVEMTRYAGFEIFIRLHLEVGAHLFFQFAMNLSVNKELNAIEG